MADFDPELYLRLLGERELAAGGDRHHDELNGRLAMPAAASAYAVTGVMDPARAASLVEDYDLAHALAAGGDDRHRAHRGRGGTSPRPPVALEPSRAYALDARVPLTGAELRADSLIMTADGSVRLCGDYVSETPFIHGPGGTGPPDLTLQTPAGKPTSLHFSGGWGETRAHGNWILSGSIDPDTPWITVEGVRIELAPSKASLAVTIEAIDSPSLPIRYLWLAFSDGGNRHGRRRGRSLEATIDALVQAGVVDPDEPQLDALRWVTAHERGFGPGPVRWTPGSTGSVMPAGVPERWRALLGAGSAQSAGAPRSPSPSGTLALSAVTPVFDGLCVAVHTLHMDDSGCTLAVEMTGYDHGGHPPETIGHIPVAWWARDDHANCYLGHIGAWHSGGDGPDGGEVTFLPLDETATQLTLEITSLNARALVPIPLDWPEPRAPAP